MEAMTPETETRPKRARRTQAKAAEPARTDHVDELFVRLDELQRNATVEAVFGRPVKFDERTLIPIAGITYFFGLGFGEGTDQDQDESNTGSGGGGGGGVRARPLAVAEITPDGLHIESVVNEQAVALTGIVAAAWSIFWIARAVVRILRG
jgi:uncharacterized spore protein YtfJ